MYVDDKNKDILILSERSTQGLDDTTLTAEGKYPINFTKPNKRFELSLNSFLFANATKKYHFKVKVSEMKYYVLCLDNISKDFTINSLKKEGLEGVNTNDTLGIHKYLMTRKWYKIMFGLIKKIFIWLLTGLHNRSNHINNVSLSNQKCMVQPTLINLHPNEYSQ